MKTFKYITLLALIVGGTLTGGHLSAKKTVVPKMYMFGFAASFTDTIVHFSEVQQVDNVWIESKNGFLLERENYSLQLRNYLAEKYKMPHRTCIVMFNQDRNKLEKSYLKLKQQYSRSRGNHFDIRQLPLSEFKFSTIDLSDVVEENNAEAEKPDKKAAKKDKKKATKKEKKAKAKQTKAQQ